MESDWLSKTPFPFTIQKVKKRLKGCKTCKIENEDTIVFITGKDPMDIVDLLFPDLHSKFYDKRF